MVVGAQRPFEGLFGALLKSVTLHTTLGELKIEIFCEAVPVAAENFLGLCAWGAYDDILFHRNIKGFMIQTGDPTGTGKGGESIYGHPFNDEIRSTLKFNARGIVAMANSNKPNTNAAQFFITYAKQPHLDGKYTILGRVIDGADSTLDMMERQPVNPKNKPLKEIRLTKVQIHANPIADKAGIRLNMICWERIRAGYPHKMGRGGSDIRAVKRISRWAHALG